MDEREVIRLLKKAWRLGLWDTGHQPNKEQTWVRRGPYFFCVTSGEHLRITVEVQLPDERTQQVDVYAGDWVQPGPWEQHVPMVLQQLAQEIKAEQDRQRHAVLLREVEAERKRQAGLDAARRVVEEAMAKAPTGSAVEAG